MRIRIGRISERDTFLHWRLGRASTQTSCFSMRKQKKSLSILSRFVPFSDFLSRPEVCPIQTSSKTTGTPWKDPAHCTRPHQHSICHFPELRVPAALSPCPAVSAATGAQYLLPATNRHGKVRSSGSRSPGKFLAN